MTNTVRMLATLIVAGFIAGTDASGAIITTAGGNGADALIRNGSWQNTNRGLEQTVQAKNDGFASFNRKFYLRFDLSSFSGPVSNAVLTLTSATHLSAAYTLNVYGLNNGVAGENWGETTITWNNAPANNTGSFSGLTSDATLLGTLSVPVLAAGSTISYASNSLVNFLNSDTNNLATLIFTTNSTGAQPTQYASKEITIGLAPPSLALNEQASVPEPSSFASLFGLAVIFILGRSCWRVRSQRGM